LSFVGCHRINKPYDLPIDRSYRLIRV
jgi:hypothetical protein